MSETLKGKVAVVTGPAGNLGQAVAVQLDQCGARLGLIDRQVDRLQGFFPEWIQSDDHLFLEGIDLTEKDDVEYGIAQVIGFFGQIDILVNTAGGYRVGDPVYKTTDEAWDFMMDLNARSVLNVSRAVIPHMLKASYGKIVNIAARSGYKGTKHHAAYAASKSVVMRLTESLSAELKNEGINVNAIVPGTIDTPANRASMPEGDYEKWVNPEELASVIRFLVSDDASAIHGAFIPVYGLS